MKERKRPFLDAADLLILSGAGMLLAGLALFDYRYALIMAGSLFLLMGILRLRKQAARRSEQ